MEQSGSMRVGPAYNIGSAGLFLALHFGALFLLLISFIFIYGEQESSIGFLILGMIAGLIAMIYFYVLLYQVWRYIIEESRRNDLRPSIDSPGKAVGFCFIPVFNVYWIFMAFGKIPTDFNALARLKNSNLRMSEGVGLAIPILSVVSIIPFVGYVTAFVNVVILIPVFVNQVVNYSKDLMFTDHQQYVS